MLLFSPPWNRGWVIENIINQPFVNVDEFIKCRFRKDFYMRSDLLNLDYLARSVHQCESNHRGRHAGMPQTATVRGGADGLESLISQGKRKIRLHKHQCECRTYFNTQLSDHVTSYITYASHGLLVDGRHGLQCKGWCQRAQVVVQLTQSHAPCDMQLW